jgi:archaemetzincin
MGEDDRQPPYLCPVCLAKVTCGVLGVKPGQDKAAEREYVLARDKALVGYCSRFPNVMMLAGLERWLDVRMRQSSQ